MMFENLKKYLFGETDKQIVASKATSLLQNEAFVIAYESLQERILGAITETDPLDSRKREYLYTKYKALEDVVVELKWLINNQSDQP